MSKCVRLDRELHACHLHGRNLSDLFEKDSTLRLIYRFENEVTFDNILCGCHLTTNQGVHLKVNDIQNVIKFCLKHNIELS